jgi:hypothetical protein
MTDWLGSLTFIMPKGKKSPKPNCYCGQLASIEAAILHEFTTTNPMLNSTTAPTNNHHFK